MSSTKDVSCMDETRRRTFLHSVIRHYVCLVLLWNFVGSEVEEDKGLECTFSEATPGERSNGAAPIDGVNDREICQNLCKRNPLCVSYQINRRSGGTFCSHQNTQSALKEQLLVDNLIDEYVKGPECQSSGTSAVAAIPSLAAPMVESLSAANGASVKGAAVKVKTKKMSKSRRLIVIALIAVVVIGGFVAVVIFAHYTLTQRRQKKEEESEQKLSLDAAPMAKMPEPPVAQGQPVKPVITPDAEREKLISDGLKKKESKLSTVDKQGGLKKTESKISASKVATTGSKIDLGNKISSTGVKFTPIETSQLMMATSGKIRKPSFAGIQSPSTNQITTAFADVPLQTVQQRPSEPTRTTDLPINAKEASQAAPVQEMTSTQNFQPQVPKPANPSEQLTRRGGPYTPY